MKIILISPLLQPYRITFYQKLSDRFKDFTVFHNLKEKEDGRPQHNEEVGFKSRGFLEYNYFLMGFYIRMVKGMFNAVVEAKPEIIIIQGFPGNVTYRKIVNWAKKNHIKVVFWYCGWEPNIKRLDFLQKIKNRLAATHYAQGDFFLTYSSKAKDDLVLQGIDPSTITVAYNGIELDSYNDYNLKKYNTQAKQLREKFAGNDRVYLYVGGLLEEKRVLFMIDAFNEFNREHPDSQLWIIGDGPQKTEVEKKIKYNSAIRYFGRITENVESYFSAADFFVLPGTGGLALNQAMYFGTPCIVGRADGTEKDLVIDNVTGFNFSEDDLNSLVYEFKKTYSMDKASIDQMGSKCKKVVELQNNVNNMVNIFDVVLSDIIAGTGQKPL
jgi:glycosyltransferase involved in cell wall biosynthesis